MENYNFYSASFIAFSKDRESDCGKIGGFVSLEQKDVEAINKLMV